MRPAPPAGRWRWLVWAGVLVLSGCSTVGGCDVDVTHPKVHEATLPTIRLPLRVPPSTIVHQPPRTIPRSPTTRPIPTSPPTTHAAPSTSPTTASASHRGERSLRWRTPSFRDPFAHFFSGFQSGAHAWVAGLGAALLVSLITIVGVALTTTLTIALLPFILIEAVAAVVLAGFYGLVGLVLALLLGMLAILLQEMLFLVALVVLAALAGPLGWIAVAPAVAIAAGGARRRSRRGSPNGSTRPSA